MRRLLLTCFLVTAALFPQTTDNRREQDAARTAHERSDRVLFPAAVSAQNAWALDHGDSNAHDHYDKFNAADRERFEAAVKAFEEWKKAMREAGY